MIGFVDLTKNYLYRYNFARQNELMLDQVSIDAKNCPSDREIFLKFKAEGKEFAKFLRSLEQFIQTVKGQNNFW